VRFSWFSAVSLSEGSEGTLKYSQIEVFWVVTLCSFVIGDSRDLKCWYPTTKLHGITPQNNSNLHHRENFKSLDMFPFSSYG